MVVPVFGNIFVGQVKQWAIVANDEYFFHAEVIDAAKSKLRAAIEENGGMTMSDIRTLIDTSRKWAVPLCEYFDESGFTKREGDLRVLA